MYLLLNLLLNALALIITATLLSSYGFHLKDYPSAILAAIVMGLINTFIKPVLLILTAPINLLTLGLFTFVVNAIVLVLTSMVVKGLQIDSFWPTAILGALVLSVISTILSMVTKDLLAGKTGKK